jgi:hypothetical protein
MVPPFLTSDPIIYFHNGWIWSIENKNPYIYSFQSFSNLPDKILFKTQYTDALCAYGPLWVYISGAVVKISFGNIIVGVILFKLIVLISYFLVWYFGSEILFFINKNKHKSQKMIVTVMLNPLVLVESISMAHNDIFCIAFVFLGILIYLKYSHCIGFVIVFLGGLVKAFALPSIAFLVLHLIITKGFNKKTIIQFILALLLCILCMIIISKPFVSSFDNYMWMFGTAGTVFSAPTIFKLVYLGLHNILSYIGLVFTSNEIKNFTAIIVYTIGIIVVLYLITSRYEETKRFGTIGPAYAIGTLIIHYWRPWYVVWPLLSSIMTSITQNRRLIAIYSLASLLTHLITKSSGISIFNIQL